MRIRKHAKLAGISLTATTAAPAGCSADLLPQSSSRFRSPHVCQLNQSPWDVISFPPDSPSSPFLVDGEESRSNYTANGSSANSLGAVESVASMKISVNVEDKNVSSYNHGIELGFRSGGTILCCKKNGKSWRCKKEASIGHAFCEHHLVHHLRDNYGSLPVHHPLAAKKLEKPAAAAAIAPTRRRGRPRKVQPPPTPPPPAVTNPYEFYYYSGFGPWWGKKRGVSRVPKPDGAEEEEIAHSSSAPPSEIDSDEFDYFEEEEEEEDNLNVKKMRRGRKPIKARSLKSLM